MALSLIVNTAGTGLILNPAGDKIVVMESPAPYDDTEDIAGTSSVNAGTLSSGVGFLRLDNDGAYSTASGHMEFFMIDNGGNRTITISKGANTDILTARYFYKLEGSVIGSSHALSLGANSVPPQYYRYRLYIDFVCRYLVYADGPDAWVRADIS
jgi:hypothetical protein